MSKGEREEGRRRRVIINFIIKPPSTRSFAVVVVIDVSAVFPNEDFDLSGDDSLILITVIGDNSSSAEHQINIATPLSPGRRHQFPVFCGPGVGDIVNGSWGSSGDCVIVAVIVFCG